MVRSGLHPGTVSGAMTSPDPHLEAPERASGPHDESSPSRRGPRLDARTIAVCACVALIAALGAALIATIVLSDDDPDAGTDDQTDAATLDLQRTEDPQGDDLLTVPLLSVDDDETNLRELHDGRPMLVNLWAQSCAPCIEEMPWLESIGAANPDISLVGVNVLDRPDKAQEMADLTGITYPWVRDPTGEMSVAARSTSLPDTYLFDADGTLVASKLGAFASEGAIQSWLDVPLD